MQSLKEIIELYTLRTLQSGGREIHNRERGSNKFILEEIF